MLRGTIEDESGRYDDALASFGLARIAWRRAGNLPGEASVDNNEGMAHAWHGHFDQAIAAFDRAAATFERFGVQDHLASTLAAKADAQRAMLDFDGSLASSERAWRLTPRMDNPRAVRSIAFTRALTLLATGDVDATLRLVDRYDDGRADAPPEFAVLRRAVARARRCGWRGRGCRCLARTRREAGRSDHRREPGVGCGRADRRRIGCT
jgi:tetratricopeptide (TPR) repeat protein